MFDGCSSLESVDLSDWDVASVTSMADMFYGCSALCEVRGGIESWDTSSLKRCEMMFFNCSSLPELDLSGWDVTSLTNAKNMFQGCSRLARINLSGWDTASITTSTALYSMFHGCTSLCEITLGTGAGQNLIDQIPLPSPSTIPGATSLWYNSAGQSFGAGEIPVGVADTYYAVPPQGVAALSASDDIPVKSDTGLTASDQAMTPGSATPSDDVLVGDGATDVDEIEPEGSPEPEQAPEETEREPEAPPEEPGPSEEVA